MLNYQCVRHDNFNVINLIAGIIINHFKNLLQQGHQSQYQGTMS